MAREEADTVSKGWCFKERHHVHTDGTRRDRNREQGGGASKNDTTYILMAREEAETVSKGWRFKERHHVHPDGMRRGRNREQGVVLQRTTPRTC